MPHIKIHGVRRGRWGSHFCTTLLCTRLLSVEHLYLRKLALSSCQNIAIFLAATIGTLALAIVAVLLGALGGALAGGGG